ncbi:MAG: hypothetical protein HC916_12765 [Coleofasciculaceae cyanobacterium SM2_1_6]|nr:hypothetical protein [Coleofasciculaceae cyanobacterium SM2_1_6]
MGVQPVTEPSNLHLFIDLDAAAMAATTGGTNTVFLDRWAARTLAGTPNIGRIVQRVINDYEKGTLNSNAIINWFTTTSPAKVNAWKSLAPAALNYLNSGGATGLNPAALAAAQNFLSNI